MLRIENLASRTRPSQRCPQSEGFNRAADDQKVCDGFGFQRGTDAYANCMMQQAAQREEETQRGMDRSQLEAAAKKLRDKH